MSGYRYEWALFADWCTTAGIEALPHHIIQRIGHLAVDQYFPTVKTS